MIAKERLEDLIEQGAIIYEAKYNNINPVRLNKNRIVILTDKYIHFRPYYGEKYQFHKYLNKLFETKEEAEWELEFGNITRTERLKLPSWEEKDVFFEFTDKDGNDIDLTICYGKILIQYYNKDNIMTKEYFNKPLTKENYIEACRLCKKLFIGE